MSFRNTTLLAMLALAGCSSNATPPDDKSYAEGLVSARAAKDVDFARSPDVVPEDRRAELLPLAYFEIDPAFAVPASLTPAKEREVLELPTSTGLRRQMQRVGRLEFSIQGQPMSLTAFHEVGSPDRGRLFVPFMDQTSGSETYPAGRYLDIDRTATGIYVIDFNLAYHPTCYYNPTYDCPFPPAENRLKIQVRAGERLKPPTS